MPCNNLHKHITLDAPGFELSLKHREKAIRSELLKADSSNKPHIALLDKQAADVQTKLHNLEAALTAYKNFLVSAYQTLDKLGQILPPQPVSKALKALLNGETLLAEQLFTAIKSRYPDKAAEAAYQLAEICYHRMDYLIAFRLYSETVDLQPDNPLYHNEAGFMAKTIGYYHEAETFYRQALQLWENEHGPQHTLVANAINNLAGLYYAQGLFGRAEPLYHKALQIKEELLGEIDLEVATSVTNLGLLNASLSRYHKAEEFYMRALSIREILLGTQHLDVAVSLTHLAGLYKTQGAYCKAERCLQQALEIKEQTLGQNHPSVANLLNTLAGLYKAKRAYAKAEPLYQRALNINIQLLGPDHPTVEAGMINYASIRRLVSRMPGFS